MLQGLGDTSGDDGRVRVPVASSRNGRRTVRDECHEAAVSGPRSHTIQARARSKAV